MVITVILALILVVSTFIILYQHKVVKKQNTEIRLLKEIIERR